MAKFCGVIGYVRTIEASKGIYEEIVTENEYYGDVIKNTRRLSGTDKVNNDVVISNRFSIIADPFANHNFHAMRYIVFMGAKWKITEVEVQYPRLILTVGGLYNE